jgi:hypothetical protein
MAKVDLGPLRIEAHGPYWWCWTFGPELPDRFVFGPWEVEFARRRPVPPQPSRTMTAEQHRQAVAGMAAEYGWTEEQVAMAGGVREALAGKISSDGGGER